MGDPDRAEGQPLVGDVIAGKYRIENIVGEGGMGIVYEAEHVILRQRVAVKALLPGAEMSVDAIERFSTEAAAVARIASEHVVRIMDAGSLPSGAPYLVMEYLEGCDLQQLLASRGPLPAHEVVDYALQVLDGLSHAHAAGVIHRDLKPANVFLAVTRDGRQVIKLVDFGISKTFERGPDDQHVMGSPIYMSPEQLRNAPLDARADLWSLGVVLYELLSGETPFRGSMSEILSAILGREAPALHDENVGVSRELSEIVARCMKHDLATRWSTTAELARALAPHGTGAWTSAIERIDRALSNAAPVPAPRRFETLETALQALEDRRDRSAHGPSTLPPPEENGGSKLAKVASPETFGETIPAPPSGEERVVIDILPYHQPAPLVSPRSALRILLIDDSEFVLGVHAQLLTRAGFEVKTTTSVSEFEGLLESFGPHLVLMDVQMPGMHGEELCRRVKARFKATIPVVFVSDLPRDQLAEHAKRGGAEAFLSKSTDWAAFVDFVRNICALTCSPEDLPP
jgi:eukaryotic-like serine/threonine-protein kinase